MKWVARAITVAMVFMAVGELTNKHYIMMLAYCIVGAAAWELSKKLH